MLDEVNFGCNRMTRTRRRKTIHSILSFLESFFLDTVSFSTANVLESLRKSSREYARGDDVGEDVLDAYCRDLASSCPLLQWRHYFSSATIASKHDGNSYRM